MPGLTSRPEARDWVVAAWQRLGGWARRRPTAVAAFLYLLLALVMFAPGLVPGRTLSASDYLWSSTPWETSRPADVPRLGANRELADSPSVFQPALLATRAALPDIPLWDPYMLSGRPFLGDPQSAVFSPFSVPAYVLPFWKSLAVMAMLKLFVAAFGAFLLARELRMRFGGALVTGLVFGFSLWSVTWVSWPHGGVWALLPWLCLFSERCVRRPGPLPAAGLAATVGAQFLAGHPASSFQVLAVVGLFWTVRVLVSRSLWPRVGLRVLTLATAVIAGAALAAVALIPFVELLAHSGDAEQRARLSFLLHQEDRRLLGLFLPDYWGHGRTAIEFGAGLVERAYYVGALPLMLAAAALIVRLSPERIAVACVGVAALAVSTGRTPLFDLVVALPGFDAANNGRFAVFTVLCLAVLAGWGLDDLTHLQLSAPRRRVVLGAAAALLMVPALIVLAQHDVGRDALGPAFRVAWGFESAEPNGPAAIVKLTSLLEWVVLAAAALGLLLLQGGRRLGGAAFIALAALLIAADLFKAGMGYNTAIPLEHALQPTTPAVRFLQSKSPARFAALDARTFSLAYPVTPNLSMRYRLHDVRGYVIPTEKRYFELWRDVIAPSPDCYYLFCTQSASTRPPALNVLALLGVRYLLQRPQDPPLRKLRSAYNGPDARIYFNPRRLPRAFLVDRQVVVRGADAALAAIARPGFQAGAVAVTERRVSGLASPGSDSSGSPGSARISSYEAERVVVDTDARRRSLLVLTDNWYPGWKATVDGEPAPIHRVDHVIRGVSVSAGRHQVEFHFEPASWRAGWIISLIALLGLAGTVVLGRRHRRGG